MTFISAKYTSLSENIFLDYVTVPTKSKIFNGETY